MTKRSSWTCSTPRPSSTGAPPTRYPTSRQPGNDIDHGIKATRAEWAALVEARGALQAVVRGVESAASLQPFLDAARLVPVAADGGLDWQLAGNAATRARSSHGTDCG